MTKYIAVPFLIGALFVTMAFSPRAFADHDEQHGGGPVIFYGMFINNGGEETTNPDVTLAIAGTWAYEMMVSNHADFRDGAWEPYITIKKWALLPGDGERTVYVKFRNIDGKVLPSADEPRIAYDSILLRSPNVANASAPPTGEMQPGRGGEVLQAKLVEMQKQLVVLLGQLLLMLRSQSN
jgi:hypothetical protein